MSLQGPLLVVAETPAADLTEALSTAGAFPIVDANWADAPTAFVSVKPAAVILAEPGRRKREAAERMLGLQIATANAPIVPTLALASPAAMSRRCRSRLPSTPALPHERLVARLKAALRVRALHETVLRRIESATAAWRRRARPADPRCPRRRHRADRRARRALSRAQRRHRRARQHGGRVQRGDRRHPSRRARHRRRRGRRRPVAAQGGSLSHLARAKSRAIAICRWR